MIELGPFELSHRIGRGAMGEVWRAVHRQQGVAVAVKVITARRARQAASRRAFRNEMRSMATLCHPGIILLFDVGEVSPEADIASRSELVAQSPYLAMELGRGTLVDAAHDIADFDAVRRVLLELLDALAHAHARGVIHRDIKPLNVLAVGPDGAAPTFKLGDFGVAHVLQGPDGRLPREDGSTTGTPRYMSPEQVIGDIHDQGPWTDIYALGCVAYWLATGEAPYAGKMADVLRAHLEVPPPRMRPRLPLPDGFEDIVRRMLAKRPADRYQRAADVTHDLLALAEAAPRSQPRAIAMASLSNDQTTIVFDRATWEASRPEADDAAPPAAPLARTWRGAAAADAFVPEQLVGAGLGLYHLRQVPLVDRDAERDALWDALCASHDARAPRAVVVRGAAGVGKTRLAQWLCERAHELGAASILKATHAPIAGPLNGVGAMLAHQVRSAGLPRLDVMERVRRTVSCEGRVPFNLTDVELLCDVIAGSESRIGARPADRRRAVARFVEAMARERPVVMWLDDVQWGVEALALALNLLEAVKAPLLIVATARDEALAEQPLAARACDALARSDGAITLALAPLSDGDHDLLVRRLLLLRADVADTVKRRTQGNALFAVQLVGDWVERGALVVTPEGLALRANEEAALPHSIHALWTARLGRLWARAGTDDPRALEIAAALGQEIDEQEWLDACRLAGVPVTDTLADHLVELRLAVPRSRAQRHGSDRAGWSFAHAMLRESIEQTADDAGRRRAHHRACAAMLETRGETRRVAEHLWRAGDWEAALGPLLDAAEQAARRGDFEQALALDDRRDEALDRAGIADDDKRRVLGWLRRARTECLRGELSTARDMMVRVESAAYARDDAEVLAALRWVQTIVARHDNELERGVALGLEALAQYRALGDDLGAARCHKKLGELYRLVGQPQRSIEHYLTARATFEAQGDHFEVAWTSMGLGSTHRQLGDLDQAYVHAQRGLASFERIGSHLGVGHAHNELGEVDRQRGRFAEAERHYERALEAWQSERHRDTDLVRFNIALTALARGETDRAHDSLRRVLAVAHDKGRRALQAYARAGLSATAAARGDFAEAAAQLDALSQLLGELGLVDLDLAQSLQRAGDSAGAAGRNDLRDAAYRLAIRQWEALGDAGRVVTLRAKLTAQS